MSPKHFIYSLVEFQVISGAKLDRAQLVVAENSLLNRPDSG